MLLGRRSANVPTQKNGGHRAEPRPGGTLQARQRSESDWQSPETERQWREAVTPPALAQKYADLFQELLSLSPKIEPETSRRSPVILLWSPEAKQRRIEFYNTHAKEMRSFKSDRLKSAWSKLEGQAARLALVFHCVRETYLPSPGDNANTISADTLDAALVWIEWLKNETRRIYYTLSNKGDARQANKLIAFARRSGGSITARDAVRACAGGRDGESRTRPVRTSRSSGPTSRTRNGRGRSRMSASSNCNPSGTGNCHGKNGGKSADWTNIAHRKFHKR